MNDNPFIKSLEFSNPVRAGEENTAHLQAEWPNPGWTHIDTQITIEEKERRIIVNLRGQRGPGMSIMVIKPFQTDLEILVPDLGDWDVVVKGRAGDHIVKITAI